MLDIIACGLPTLDGDSPHESRKIHRLTSSVSHFAILQIFDDEYAVLHPLLEHSSSVSVLKSPLLAVPTFEITFTFATDFCMLKCD